jgi:ANTAR domain/GAF domain
MPSAATIEFSRPLPTELVMSVSGVVDGPAVEEIAVRLSGAGGSPGLIAVVDLSAVPHCDIRVLTVLDRARRELAARGGVLHVRGLTAESFPDLADADLPGILDAYRASLAVAAPTGPWEPGGSHAVPTRSAADLDLVRACAGLATVPPEWDGGRSPVLDLADLLVAQGLRHVAVSAVAVLLRGPSGDAEVVASSTERATLVESAGAAADEGPAAECLLRGEPVSSPHLDRATGRWPVYAPLALQHGFAAARGLPIRTPAALRTGRAARTIGALALLGDTAGPLAAVDLEVAQSFADLAAIALTGIAARSARDAGSPGIPPTAVASRMVVEQAKGVLAGLGNVSMAKAEAQLRRHAQVHGVTVSEVAYEVTEGRLVQLGTDPLTPWPPGVYNPGFPPLG